MYQNKAFPNKIYITIKLLLHDAFQIYNHLLTEVNAKTMIRDQTQEH
jgi:hypothetical protein